MRGVLAEVNKTDGISFVSHLHLYSTGFGINNDYLKRGLGMECSLLGSACALGGETRIVLPDDDDVRVVNGDRVSDQQDTQ